MALVQTLETLSYRQGGANGKIEIIREVKATAAAAADVADTTVILPAVFGMAKATGASTLINATGQAFDLVAKYDGSGWIVFKKGTFTPTDLVFYGLVKGR
jgi:hypothetical protein